MANLKPVGANFKAKGRVQMPKPLVMAKFSPQGQDSSGFRMASEPVKNMESSSQEASSGQTQSADKKEQGEETICAIYVGWHNDITILFLFQVRV